MLKIWYILKELILYILIATIIILSSLIGNNNIIANFIYNATAIQMLVLIGIIIFIKSIISGLIQYGKQHQRTIKK